MPRQGGAANGARWSAAVLAGLLACSATPPATAVPDLDAGRLGTVRVFVPSGEPTGVVLFASPAGSWTSAATATARELQGLGALVGGIDTGAYLATLARDPAACGTSGADLERLARRLEQHAGLTGYRPPFVAGEGAGAALAYTAVAEAPRGTFAGLITLGFRPSLAFARHRCRGAGPGATPATDPPRASRTPDAAPDVPWVALQAAGDAGFPPEAARSFMAAIAMGRVVPLPGVGPDYAERERWLPQFRDAYLKLATSAATDRSVDDALADLPLVEVPARAGAGSPFLAVLLTGDGGYAGLDRDLAGGLAAAGIPVVVLSTLKYFWRQRTPAAAAADLDRVLRHYLDVWHKQRVLLVGYSFGANVLPFLVNRLPDATRARVTTLNLLGAAPRASFEIHVADWIPGTVPAGPPVAPEFARGRLAPTLCIYGEEEAASSLCGILPRSVVRAVAVPGGHHFGGDAARLVREILAFAGR